MKFVRWLAGAAVALSLLSAPIPAAAAEAGAPGAAVTNRPRIGLVLGGGGALGFAHIGVLRVLEEARIPIDYIAGTSMGSIIGGLYAAGMSPDEIQSFLQALDWNEVMTDETPRRDLFFRRKVEDQRYLFEMGMGWGKPKLGTGMAAGQKLNNVLQYLSLRAVAVTNFNALPIPYRAVATDLESGKAYVIDHGNLARAMRASMSVPGAFTPVSLDGRILVDGGIVNNLPVDVAKEMGASFIIAVDVGSGGDTVKAAELGSLGAVLGRTYAIAQRPDQIRNYKLADLGIQPPLLGFSASQFDRIAKLAPEGEKAARDKMDDLKRLGVSPAEFEAYLARQRRPHPASMVVGEIEVTGNERVSEEIIRGRIRSEPGEPFDKATVNRDLMNIYGIGEFEQVRFNLSPTPDGTSKLVYDTLEKDWGPMYFKYGLRLQSDFEKDAQWGMLLNMTRMSLNSLGGEWRNEAEIGSMTDVISEFYQPLDRHGFLFVAPSLEYHSEFQDVYVDDNRIAEYEVSFQVARFDVGVQWKEFAEFRVGPYWGNGDASVETGAADLPKLDEDLAGWETTLTVDRLDRTIFARQGYFLRLEGDFSRKELGAYRDYEKLLAEYRGHHSIDNHTLVGGLRYGTSPSGDLPGYAQFTLGGPFGFAGLAEDQFRGSEMAIASLGYRYRLVTLPSTIGRGVYTFTRFDVGNVWANEDEREFSDTRTGVALGLGADTTIGPILVGFGAAEGGYSRWYFSLGTAF